MALRKFSRTHPLARSRCVRSKSSAAIAYSPCWQRVAWRKSGRRAQNQEGWLVPS